MNMNVQYLQEISPLHAALLCHIVCSGYVIFIFPLAVR